MLLIKKKYEHISPWYVFVYFRHKTQLKHVQQEREHTKFSNWQLFIKIALLNYMHSYICEKF